MICTECKRDVAEGLLFCPACGSPIDTQRFVAADQPTGLPAETIGSYRPDPMPSAQVPRDTPAWEGLAARGRNYRRDVVAAAGLVLGALVVLVLMVSLAPSSQARRPPKPPQQLTEDQLQAGDCLTGSNMGLGTGSAWPETVTVVPCTQRHIAEVYYVGYPWPLVASNAYPGDQAVFKVEDERCTAAFKTYDGIDVPSVSVLLHDEIGPTPASSWESGNREVVCVAYYSGNLVLRHSFKGSGQ